MCQRHHRFEPFTFQGMSVVICDDAPHGGAVFTKDIHAHQQQEGPTLTGPDGR